MPINVFMDFIRSSPTFFQQEQGIGKIENKQTTLDTIYCLRQN